MKKEVLSAAGALLVAVMLLLLVLLPDGEEAPPTGVPSHPTSGTTQAPVTLPPTTKPTPTFVPTPGPTLPEPPVTTFPTRPTEPEVPTTGPTEPSMPPETEPTEPTEPTPAPGVVRLYTCDPALQEVYVQLASQYYAKTGTEVQVLTPNGGSCEETLLELLSQENAPTLFCIHSQQMLNSIRHGLYDLTGSYAASQLYGNAFALQSDGKILGLAADVAGSGLIYNASKLANAAWTDEDLVDFDMLSVAVASIKAKKDYAFTCVDFNDTHLMEHLAGLFDDPQQLRDFVDLYFANSTVQTTTLKYFLNSTTVFYIGGTRDYEHVASLGTANLRFLPAYAKDSTAVQCFCDHYWAVSGTASAADTEVTLAFLDYLVTPQEDGIPADALGLLLPFRGAAHSGNVLEEKLRIYMATGNACVSWSVSGKVTDLSAFTAALKAYKSSATDANWKKIAELFGKE